MNKKEVKGWEVIFYVNINDIKDGEAIILSEKLDFKTKSVTKGKQGRFIVTKESIQKEDITLKNSVSN